MLEGAAGYTFDRSFQDRIVALCLQDRTFFLRNYDFIRPEFFELDMASRIIRALSSWKDNHRAFTIPDEVTVRALVSQYYVQSRLPKDAEQAALEYLDYLYRLELNDHDTISSLVMAFGGMNEILKCQADVLSGLDQGWTIDQAIQRMQATIIACSKGGSPGMSGEEMLTDITKLYELQETDIVSKMISTGIPSLDAKMRGGGGAPGDFVVVMAPPKTGKTTSLVCFGAAALEQDAVVYHVTNEMTENDIMVKYASCLSGIPYTSFLSCNREAMEEYQAIYRMNMEGRMRCRLYVKYWAPQAATANTIEAWMLQKIAETGNRPDVLIVDWADRLKSSTYSRDDSWGRLGSVYEELIALCGKMPCMGYSATQPQREAYIKRYLQMHHAAGSIQKIEQATLVLSLNQTHQENADGELRMLIAGSRIGPKNWVIPCSIGYDKVFLKERESSFLLKDEDMTDDFDGQRGFNRKVRDNRPWREQKRQDTGEDVW